jgi:hypothetical protein
MGGKMVFIEKPGTLLKIIGIYTKIEDFSYETDLILKYRIDEESEEYTTIFNIALVKHYNITLVSSPTVNG